MYMTEEAWVELAPKMAAGIRAMPIIRDNPQWWVIKIIDGFGPHTSSIDAMAEPRPRSVEAHRGSIEACIEACIEANRADRMRC
jgi:hypothetical protein